MDKTTTEWLSKWHERSQQRQQAFISNITERLGSAAAQSAPPHPYKGAPYFWQSTVLDPEACIALFMDNWTRAGGHAERFATMDEVKAFIVSFCKETGAEQLLMQRQAIIEKLELQASLPETACTVWQQEEAEQMREAAVHANVGIAAADHAVAFTGSVVFKSGPDKGRITSLLPPALIVIIPAKLIKHKLGDVMTGLDAQPKESLPAGIHFVSGPSRSADIENDLTIGVHGPGIVYALILDSLA